MKPRNKTAEEITADVLKTFDKTTDPRLKQVMESLVRHLHAFVTDVKPSTTEWLTTLEFLKDTARYCDDTRNEFILLCDTLGVSILIDLINNGKPEGATESTLLGPVHRLSAPELPHGTNIASESPEGIPTVVKGRVLDLVGSPIPGAVIDVWQANAGGFYDSQVPELDGKMDCRGKFRSDNDGRFFFRTVRPKFYSVPVDGSVGRMLRAVNRHSMRPSHIHFMIYADGFESVTAHVFDANDKHLEGGDTAFAVKQSLIRPFVFREQADEESKRLGINSAYCLADLEFILAKSA
jgi:protocatechuate 3,4-dioxygenase beta subunit